MRRVITAVGLCLGSFLVPAVAAGQEDGAQQFISKQLTVNATSDTHSIFLSSDVSQGPAGTSGFVGVTSFNLVTFEFSQCFGSDVDLVVTNGRIALSFVIDSGFDCSAVGQTASVTCNTTPDSGIAHRVFSGTSFVAGQRFTTHGTSWTYFSLTCNLRLFESDLVGTGDAGATTEMRTP